MRRRDRTRDKAVKAQRRKTLERRNAPKVARPRKPSAADITETIALLTRERDGALQRQTATADVLKVMSRSTFDLPKVLNTLVESAARLCEADTARIVRPTGKEASYYVAAVYGSTTPEYDEHVRTLTFLPGRGSVVGRVLLEGNSVQIPDVLADPEYTLRETQKLAGYRTSLGVPLLREGSPIGLLVLQRATVRPFTGKEIELAETFAAQAVIAIENTRLLNELRESLQQQTATADVLKVISSSPGELKPVFQAMLEQATRICDAKFGIVFRYESGLFYPAAFLDVPAAYADFLDRQGSFPPKPGKLFGQLCDSKAIINILDRADEPDVSPSAKLGGARSSMAVPMLKDNELVGALFIYRTEVVPFTDKQIGLVKNFASQAVIAIENARLLNELRESLQQQTATADVLKVISRSTFDLKTVLQTLVESAARLCDADKATITRERNGAFYRTETYGFSHEFMEYIKQVPIEINRGSASGRALIEGRAIHIADVKADPEYTMLEAQRRGDFRTILCVPMLRESVPIGVLALHRSEVRPFTDKQIELVTIFADQAAIAIENVRLFDEVQARTRELSESLEQQTATSEVLKVISSSPGELEPVFNAMLANATRICEAMFGGLFLYEAPLFRATAIHSKQSYDDYLRRNPVVDLRENPGTPLDRVANSKRVVHIPDLRTDQSYIGKNRFIVRLVEAVGARTFVSVPMLKEGELIGAINMYREEAQPFTEKQIELVQNFAAQAVIAIENARLLSELRESLQQQTATAEVLKVISRSTFDLGTVLQTLVESAARLCDADKTNITRQKDGVFFRAEAFGFSHEFMNYVKNIPIQPDRGSAFGRALLERRAVHIPDVKADPEYTLVEGQRLGDYRSVLAVPMVREGNAIGVLSLTRSEVRPFSEKQIELATTFADQAAIAIENVRLFESVEARTRELAKSLEDLRATQDRLVQTQKLASLGQLTAGIAHEIKNPLNFVNNFSAVSAELIDELRQALAGAQFENKLRTEINEIADTLQSNLDKVVQHGKRADAIVKNMLLHSREGSGEHRLADINGLVEEGLNLAYHGARAEKQGFNIKLEKSFDPNAGEADVFPQDITRVLLNLISNGFYAATKRSAETNGGDYEPTLAAATKSRGDCVEITIRDNGTGIPADVKEKMFNPFFTTKPAGEGTGLGLSISHDIVVKQHGGSIEVNTEPGEFTEVRIILPRAAASLSK
jgi:GAF domain-containing protein